jgi:hypothetical protein
MAFIHKNVFNTTQYNPVHGRNTFNAASSFASSAIGNVGTAAQTSMTTLQLNALQTVHDSYANMLASKSFEKIPTNYNQYLDLLNQLKSIKINDSNLQLLIQIAENSLVSSMNVGALYSNYAYNEIKVALLNKRIKEILSDKNNKETISSVTGQFSATQVFKLAPIYSYYVYLYGMPEFGVGFDPSKLAFIRSLPAFTVKGRVDNDIVEQPYTTAPSGIVVDVV